MNTYIIHERPYNEKKKYVVLFNRDTGVHSTSTSQKKSIHYFVPYQTLVNRKKTSLQDPIQHPANLSGKKLYCGLYLNELIYRFCKPLDPHLELFDQYVLSLSLLRQNADLSVVLRHFELKLLESCGYGIDIAHIDTPYVSFSKHLGFVGQTSPTEHSIAISDLKRMIEDLKPSTEVKLFFRHILHTLLSSSLQSRLLYDKIS